MDLNLDDASISRIRELARIKVADDGGPIRTIIGTRPLVWTGEYYSAKTRRSHPWESPFERDDFYRLEVDPEVESYLAQPHQLEVFFDGRQYHYIPDVRVEFSNRRVEIREVKKSKKEIVKDAFYEAKLMLARAVYEELGWAFRVVDEVDIRKPAIVFANSREIQLDGPLEIRQGEVDTVCAIFARANGPEVSLGRIAEALGGWVRGSSLVRAMVVHRILQLPLNRLITHETPVKLVSRKSSASRPSFANGAGSQ